MNRRCIRVSARVAPLWLSVVLCVAGEARAQSFTFYDLGSSTQVPNQILSQALGVNNQGIVVGYGNSPPMAGGEVTVPLVWSAPTTAAAAVQLPVGGAAAGTSASAVAINNLGYIIGTVSPLNTASYADLWRSVSGGPYNEVGLPAAPGGAASGGVGIDNFGFVVESSLPEALQSCFVSCSFLGRPPPASLTALAGGNETSVAAISSNAAGTIAWGLSNVVANGAVTTPVYWTTPNAVIQLTLSPGFVPSGANSNGAAATAAGSCSGAPCVTTTSAAPTILPGVTSGTAKCVNNSGQIVGFSGTTTYYWSSSHALPAPLDNFLPAAYASAGWQIIYVGCINDNGWIVGGMELFNPSNPLNGSIHAVLLVPTGGTGGGGGSAEREVPLPGWALALLGVALAAASGALLRRS